VAPWPPPRRCARRPVPAGVSNGWLPGAATTTRPAAAPSAGPRPQSARRLVSEQVSRACRHPHPPPTLKSKRETCRRHRDEIISASGLVLTNNHVIDQATEVQCPSLGRQSGCRTPPSTLPRCLGYDATDDAWRLPSSLVAGLRLPGRTLRQLSSRRSKPGPGCSPLGHAEGRRLGSSAGPPGHINALAWTAPSQASRRGSTPPRTSNTCCRRNARDSTSQGDSRRDASRENTRVAQGPIGQDITAPTPAQPARRRDGL